MTSSTMHKKKHEKLFKDEWPKRRISDAAFKKAMRKAAKAAIFDVEESEERRVCVCHGSK